MVLNPDLHTTNNGGKNFEVEAGGRHYLQTKAEGMYRRPSFLLFCLADDRKVFDPTSDGNESPSIHTHMNTFSVAQCAVFLKE